MIEKSKKFKLIGLMILAVFILGFVVLYLWNFLMPELFGLQTINYWQAIGIFVLSKILFGRIGIPGRPNRGPRFANRAFKQKFMNMSEEEKLEFKEKWRERCKK